MAALLGVFGVGPAAIIVAVMDAVDVWAGRLEHILSHALKKELNNLCYSKFAGSSVMSMPNP